MAMTLRLPADLDLALTEIAERKHMSKHAVIIEATERFVVSQGRRADLDAAVDFVLQHDAELLDRLADA